MYLILTKQSEHDLWGRLSCVVKNSLPMSHSNWTDCWMTASRDATVQTHTRSLMHQQKKHSIPFCNPRSPWSLSVISPYCSSSSLYWHMAASQSPFSLHRQQKVSNCSICLGSPLSITMLVSFSLLCFCIFWSKRCPVFLLIPSCAIASLWFSVSFSDY